MLFDNSVNNAFRRRLMCAGRSAVDAETSAALLHAARSVTMGKCLRPAWNVTSISTRAPGLPRTSAHGFAQGEPRGHRDRGSKRGLRLAGKWL